MKNKTIFTLLSVILISLPPVSQAGTRNCENAFTGKDLILERITKDRASFIRDYQGQGAYLRFTEELPIQLNMNYVFAVVSQNLSEKEKKDLNWQAFHGTTKEYRKLRELILDNQGNIKPEYIGMDGYASFADTHFEGAMQKTYINISVVLDKELMQKLEWQQFQGTTEDYKKLTELILDNQGDIKPKYIGIDGYASFADTHFEGNMKKTYINISAVLDKELMRKLGWQQFQGTTEDYKKLTELILDNQGDIKPKYIGIDGYASFADTHFEGNMKKTYINISAVLDKELMRKLGWQQFQGTTEDYKKLRELILDNQGNIKPEYIGIDGYASFADTHFEGAMQKTYINISAVLGGVKATREWGLQWKSFQGTTSQFYALKELFKRYGVEQLRGSDGQEKVAREIFKGNRQRTYHNVSILREELLGSKTVFNELKW